MSLGIIPKSENKTDEMVEILDQLHTYVPGSKGSDGADMQQLSFGGDCLTSMRGRQAQKVRVNSSTTSDALRGLVPFPADWHAKVNFITVCLNSILCWMLDLAIVPYFEGEMGIFCNVQCYGVTSLPGSPQV